MTMDLHGQRILVVGLGKSGLAAARLLASRGATVIGNDMNPNHEPSDSLTSVVVGSHPESLFISVDRIVVSPGVPALPALDAAEKKGVPIASEIELASWFVDPATTVIGITGTNGKSTVTTLVGEMLTKTGRPTFVGGNLGTPLVDVADSPAAGPGGAIVVELSSFQLERVDRFHANVAVLLNVTDDHLDRHHTFAAYAAAKARVFHAQTPADHAVIPSGDEIVRPLARAGRAKLHEFGGDHGEVRVSGDAIVDVESGLRLPVSALRIRGAHNVDNACAAALAARLAGVDPGTITEVLSTFSGLPHRMAFVRERAGVVYYDDSKATNVGAAVAALLGLRSEPQTRGRSESGPRVVLIVGGVDKGGSYAPLAARARAQCRAVVLIGAAADLIEREFRGNDLPHSPTSSLPIIRATTIDDAVAQAATLAERGDVVLLAPACASFDMFRSYAHRGDEFARAVRALPEAPDAR